MAATCATSHRSRMAGASCPAHAGVRRMNRIWIGGVAVVAAIAAMATNPAQSVFTEKARNELIVRQLVQDPAAFASTAAGKPAFIASKEAVAFPESIARETSRKGP